MNINHKQLESGNTPAPQLFFKLKKHKKKTKKQTMYLCISYVCKSQKKEKKTTEKLNAGQYILHK